MRKILHVKIGDIEVYWPVAELPYKTNKHPITGEPLGPILLEIKEMAYKDKDGNEVNDG